MKLGSLAEADTQRICEVASSEVRILWVNDFYDGPLQGMAEVRGERLLFDIIDRDAVGGEDEKSRKYWLIELKPNQLQEEERWHDLFCRKVGTHFDYTGRPRPAPSDVCLDDFYGPYRRRSIPDYKDNEVIGWFQLGS